MTSMANPQVVIIMDSDSDRGRVERMWEELDTYKIKYATRAASAQWTPSKLLDVLAEYEDKKPVIITVASLPDACATDANTANPVIACSNISKSPPYVTTEYTSPGVAPIFDLSPISAAENAVKILSLTNSSIYHKLMVNYGHEPMEREPGREVVLVTYRMHPDEIKEAKKALGEFGIEYSEVELENFNIDKYTNKSIFLTFRPITRMRPINRIDRENFLPFPIRSYHPIIRCALDLYAPFCVQGPDNSALALAKIVGMYDDKVREKVCEFQQAARSKVEKADFEFSKSD